MLTQKGQKQEGYHLGDSMEVAWRPPPGAPSMAVHGRLALAGAFPGHTPSLGIPGVCSALLFTSGINTALYPFRIPDPTGIVFSSVGLCLVD